jgi:hypothetical protein
MLLLLVESRTLSLILFWIYPNIGVDTLEPEAALSKIGIYDTYNTKTTRAQTTYTSDLILKAIRTQQEVLLDTSILLY